MNDDIVLKNGIIIPSHELEFSASRAGGPGGQHVNKTSTRITVRWNVHKTNALDDAQKHRVLQKLAHELTSEGELVVHSGASRSQFQNKKEACNLLAKKITKALHIPKKRIKSHIPAGAQEARLHKKKRHSEIKKMRSKKVDFD